MIDNFFINEGIQINKFQGYETQEFRKKYGYHKVKSDKSKVDFRTHCSDALAISTEVMNNGSIKPTDNFVYVDDNYRCIRRRLHDTQYSKGGIRHKFSQGNFCGIRKGTIVGFDGGYGQLVGGTKEDIKGKEQSAVNYLLLRWCNKCFFPVLKSAFSPSAIPKPSCST